MTPWSPNRLRVEELAEEALIKWIASHPDLAGVEVVSVQENTESDELQRINVRVESQGEHAPGLGVHRLTARVTIEADALARGDDDQPAVPEPLFKQWVSALKGYLFWETLPAELELKQSGLRVYGVLRNQSNTAKNSTEDRWSETTSIVLLAIETP